MSILSRIGAVAGEAAGVLIDLLFPPRCPLCAELVGAQTGLCAACWAQLAIPGHPRCVSCARPFGEAASEGMTCAACLASPPRHDGIAAATLYNDASRQLVLQLKHGGRIALAPLMARLIVPQLPDPGGEGWREWLLVPVPLHRWRLWKRGYNQAAEIARGLAGQTGARLLPDALVRRKRTPSLGGLGRKARARTLSGAIVVAPARADQLLARNVLLVDDVLTSGATTDACVSALQRAGAARVHIACFARVLDEALDATEAGGLREAVGG